MLNSTRIQQQGHKKRGGTLIHMRRKWASMDMQHESDYHGRWSRVTITGSKERKITVISSYRVCYNTVEKAGGENF